MEKCMGRVDALQEFMQTPSFNPWDQVVETVLPLSCAMVGNEAYLMTFEPGCHADDGKNLQVCERLTEKDCANATGCHFLPGETNCAEGAVRIMCAPSDDSYAGLQCYVRHYPNGFSAQPCTSPPEPLTETCQGFKVTYDTTHNGYRFVENSLESLTPMKCPL